MPRPLRGKLTETPRGWTVEIPSAPGSKKRRQHTFRDKESATRWREAAITALQSNRAVPDPHTFAPVARRALGPVSTRFADVAWACWEEEYRDNDLCSPGNRKRIATDLQLWIIPYFEALGGEIANITRDDVKHFVRVMSGRDPFGSSDAGPRLMVRRIDILTVTQVVELTGLHASSVRRALKAGRFPGALRIATGPQRGQYRIPASDVLDAGLPIEPRRVASSGRRRAGIGSGAAARSTAREILRVLRTVFVYARAKGLVITDPTEGVKALPPVRDKAFTPPKEARPRAFSFEESKAVAAHLHIHHQVAFWLQRVLGLRVAEAFGLHLRTSPRKTTAGCCTSTARAARSSWCATPRRGPTRPSPRRTRPRRAAATVSSSCRAS